MLSLIFLLNLTVLDHSGLLSLLKLQSFGGGLSMSMASMGVLTVAIFRDHCLTVVMAGNLL